MTPAKRLQSVRICNFKAIVDSKTVKLGVADKGTHMGAPIRALNG